MVGATQHALIKYTYTSDKILRYERWFKPCANCDVSINPIGMVIIRFLTKSKPSTDYNKTWHN